MQPELPVFDFSETLTAEKVKQFSGRVAGTKTNLQISDPEHQNNTV